MPDDKTRNEPWRAQMPDYMVAAIDSICEARDEIRAMQAELSKGQQELNNKEQIIGDRERSLLNAIDDMREFANRIYGPDSELTKINTKLGSIESASAARETAIKDSFTRRFEQVETRVRQLEDRVGDLEKSA